MGHNFQCFIEKKGNNLMLITKLLNMEKAKNRKNIINT